MKHVQRAQIILLSAERLLVLAIAKQQVSASAGRWCGAGSSASPRKALRSLLRDKTRPPASAPVAQAKVHAVVERNSCANRPVQSPIGPAAPSGQGDWSFAANDPKKAHMERP